MHRWRRCGMSRSPRRPGCPRRFEHGVGCGDQRSTLAARRRRPGHRQRRTRARAAPPPLRSAKRSTVPVRGCDHPSSVYFLPRSALSGLSRLSEPSNSTAFSSSTAIARSNSRGLADQRLDHGLDHRVAVLVALADHLIVGLDRLRARLERRHPRVGHGERLTHAVVDLGRLRLDEIGHARARRPSCRRCACSGRSRRSRCR